MDKYSLISYANGFVTFLLRDKTIAKSINQIIIFGSVPRGDFTGDSDIDLFIDVKQTTPSLKRKIEEKRRLFSKSKLTETWRIRGITNDIRLKIGVLKKWSELRRSIITDGFVLYGKYTETPKGLKHKVLIKFELEHRKRNENVRLWRKLYGYRQKVGKKTYVSKGLIEKLGGYKPGKSVLVIPINSLPELISFLKENKIKHKVFEFWSEG